MKHDIRDISTQLIKMWAADIHTGEDACFVLLIGREVITPIVQLMSHDIYPEVKRDIILNHGFIGRMELGDKFCKVVMIIMKDETDGDIILYNLVGNLEFVDKNNILELASNSNTRKIEAQYIGI